MCALDRVRGMVQWVRCFSVCGQPEFNPQHSLWHPKHHQDWFLSAKVQEPPSIARYSPKQQKVVPLRGIKPEISVSQDWSLGIRGKRPVWLWREDWILSKHRFISPSYIMISFLMKCLHRLWKYSFVDIVIFIGSFSFTVLWTAYLLDSETSWVVSVFSEINWSWTYLSALLSCIHVLCCCSKPSSATERIQIYLLSNPEGQKSCSGGQRSLWAKIKGPARLYLSGSSRRENLILTISVRFMSSFCPSQKWLCFLCLFSPLSKITWGQFSVNSPSQVAQLNFICKIPLAR